MVGNSPSQRRQSPPGLTYTVVVFLQEARCGYVILLMAVYWCTEVIPLAVTALLPVVLFPMLGVLESKKVRQEGC